MNCDYYASCFRFTTTTTVCECSHTHIALIHIPNSFFFTCFVCALKKFVIQEHPFFHCFCCCILFWICIDEREKKKVPMVKCRKIKLYEIKFICERIVLVQKKGTDNNNKKKVEIFWPIQKRAKKRRWS